MNPIMSNLGGRLARYLSRPNPRYQPLATTDPQAVAAAIAPGDVLLVEGNTRFSTAIKYLSQSTWSHAALYVGNAVDPRDAARRELVEADVVHGVTTVPLEKYDGMHTRICRPVGLSAEDRARVIGYALARGAWVISDRFVWSFPMNKDPDDPSLLVDRRQHEQLVGLQRHLGCGPDGPRRGLPYDDLERLVAAEEHLLGVAVRSGVGEQPVELEEDAEPAFLSRRRDLGRNAGEVDGAVHGLPGAEEDALAEVVVGPSGRRQVDGQIGNRRVRRRLGAADDAVHPDVRRQVAVGLLEQLEGQIQLGLGDLLAEVVVETVCHALPSGDGSPQGQSAGWLGWGQPIRAARWSRPARWNPAPSGR